MSAARVQGSPWTGAPDHGALDTAPVTSLSYAMGVFMYKILIVYQNNVTGMEQCFYEDGEYFYKALAQAHANALKNSLKNDGVDKFVVYVVNNPK